MKNKEIIIPQKDCLKIAILTVLLIYILGIMAVLALGLAGSASTKVMETIYTRGNGTISEYSDGGNTKVEFAGTGRQYFTQTFEKTKNPYTGPSENRSVKYSLDSAKGPERGSYYRFEAKAEDQKHNGFEALWLSSLSYIRAESEATVGERVVDTSNQIVAFADAWHRMRTTEDGVTTDIVDRFMAGEWNMSTTFHFDWEKDIPEDWLACPLPNPDTQAPAGGWQYPEIPKWEEKKG